MRSSPWRYRLALVLVLAVALVQAADAAALRIVELKHRPADDILPVVRPLVAPGGAMSGRGFRLFVRTSETNFREIERAVAALDVPRRNLKITVRQTTNVERANRMQRISGRATVGTRTRITIPGTASNTGSAAATGHREAAALQYEHSQRTASREHTATHFVRVLEGQRAFVRIGQSISQVQPFVTLSHEHLGLLVNVAYRDVTTGFEVLPRVRGDRVAIEITPKLSFHTGHAFQPVIFHEMRTTVLVELGEWVDLAQVLGTHNTVAHAILAHGATSAREAYTVMLKVE